MKSFTRHLLLCFLVDSVFFAPLAVFFQLNPILQELLIFP